MRNGSFGIYYVVYIRLPGSLARSQITESLFDSLGSCCDPESYARVLNVTSINQPRSSPCLAFCATRCASASNNNNGAQLNTFTAFHDSFPAISLTSLADNRPYAILSFTSTANYSLYNPVRESKQWRSVLRPICCGCCRQS